MANPLPNNSLQIDLKDSPNLKAAIGDEQVELTSSKLEKWFAHVELSLNSSKNEPAVRVSDDNAPELATQLLSRFGLQTTEDVIKFFKSPEGKETLTLINEELAEIAAINDHIRQDALEHQLLAKRALAFLLLGLLDRREAKAHRLNEIMQQDIDKKSHDAEKASSTKLLETARLNKSMLEPVLQSYTNAANEIEKSLQSKLQDAEKLEEKLAKINQKGELMTAKYACYDKLLDLKYEEMSHITDGSPSVISKIKTDIEVITKQIYADAQKISELLDTGTDEDELAARQLMEESNARNLQVAILEDMLSVLSGDKTLCKEDGSPATSFADADLIVPKANKVVEKNGIYYLLNLEDKLVEKNGICYLLKANQKLDDMTLDAQKDAANHAAEEYLQLKPEMTGVKKVVEHNRGLEQEIYLSEKNSVYAESDRMQKDILLLANHLELQIARANEATLAQQTSIKPAPRMTHLPSLTPSTSMAPAMSNQIPNPQWAGDSYRHILRLMRDNPSQSSINWLKTALAYDKTPELLREINKLKPNMPIPATTMQSLLSRRDIGSSWANNNEQARLADEKTTPSPSMRPNGLLGG